MPEKPKRKPNNRIRLEKSSKTLEAATDKTRIKKGAKTEEVIQRLKEMIFFNQLAPGQKLICSSLSAKLNVSATPLIQALNRLKAGGLVEYKLNRGYFVAEISENEAKQLYHAREALEVYIIPAVIRNIDAHKISSITASFKRHRETNRNELILTDATFHLKIAQYGENQVIYDLLKDIFERIYIKYRTQYIDDNRIHEVVREHKMLLSAINDKDEIRASEIVRAHLNNGLEHLIAWLRGRSSTFF